MKIGFIGAGGMGRIYATLWHKAGHEVFLSARNHSPHRGFVAGLGARAHLGTPAEAAAFGDVILLAVNYETANQALEQIAPILTDKLVIDATNPMGHDANGKLEALLPKDQIASEVMAANR